MSWLIYLSETTDDDAHATTSTSTDDDGVVDGDDGNSAWDAKINGGLLRTFPQKWYQNTLNDGSSWADTVAEMWIAQWQSSSGMARCQG